MEQRLFIKNNESETLLSMTNDYKMFMTLIDCPLFKLPDSSGRFILYKNKFSKNTLEMLIYLVEIKKINYNTQSSIGDTMLIYAIFYDHPIEIIQYLLNLPDINITIMNKDDNDALYFAVKKNNLLAVKAILEKLESKNDTPNPEN